MVGIVQIPYKKSSLFYLSLLCGCALFSSQSFADTGFATQEKLLKNGLKVIVREDKRAPITLVQMWYKVGSADESGNLLGISHVLEHMMFKGTNKVPNGEFARLSRVYGGSVNAATFTNYTNYYQLYPAAYLPLALELEADRMSNLNLKQDDFATEIKVVMEERRQRTDDNPRSLAFERFKWLAYPTSHYRNPIIGHMKNLQAIRLNDLKQWYQTWYAPNNAILVVVGDVDANKTFQLAEQYFGKIPSRTLPARQDLKEFSNMGYRHMRVNMPVQVPNLLMAWNVNSLATSTNRKDALALALMQSILDTGLSARFKTRLIRDQKLFTSTAVSYDLYNRGDTLFYISAIPESQLSLAQAEQHIKNEIDRFKTELVSTDELKRVINMFISHYVYGQDTLIGQAKLIGNLEVNGLSHQLMDTLPAQFEDIKPQDLQRVARQYFVDDNLTSLHLLPSNQQP